MFASLTPQSNEDAMTHNKIACAACLASMLVLSGWLAYQITAFLAVEGAHVERVVPMPPLLSPLQAMIWIGATAVSGVVALAWRKTHPEVSPQRAVEAAVTSQERRRPSLPPSTHAHA